MKATNIKWDTDGYVIEWLPTIVEIPQDIEEMDIADYLSDEYGFCVESFTIERTIPCNTISIGDLCGFIEDEEIFSNERMNEINAKYHELCKNASESEINDYYDNYEGLYPPFVAEALS